MQEVLFSTTILASFLAGFVALLAPCCVSVMLPAFFATTFRRKSRIVAMTLVFAAGVGAVILPIALGAAAVSRLLIEYHTPIFTVGGLAMILMGMAILAGRKIMLPMLFTGGGAGGGSLRSVFALGAFSGAASACCAPVLAGVVAVSGAASSFPAATAVGVAYVFGMVAPLSVLALVWDNKKIGEKSFLTDRKLRPYPGSSRTIPMSAFLSGILMLTMGALTIVLAVRGPGMAPDGWGVRLAADMSHLASQVQRTLEFIPGWLSTLAIFVALGALIIIAVRNRTRKHAESTPSQASGASEAEEFVPVLASDRDEPGDQKSTCCSTHPPHPSDRHSQSAPEPGRGHDPEARKTRR